MKTFIAERREFLKQSGALVVGFSIASAGLAQQLATRPALPGSLNNNRMLDGWLRINADGTVTVFTGKVELGQGILTALAQIAAEELDVALERIVMVPGNTSVSPNEWYTAGSLSMEDGGSAMRAACAEVRKLFVEAAARKLEVSAADLEVRDGSIQVPGTDLRTSYWALAGEVSLATDRRSPG